MNKVKPGAKLDKLETTPGTVLYYCTHMHPCNIFSHYIYLQNCFKVLLKLYANDKTYAKINSSRTACLKTLRAAKESKFLDFSTLSIIYSATKV